ncbi:MAG: xanthine dehydrogenase family protein subunit M [Herpetosiphon sp.]
MKNFSHTDLTSTAQAIPLLDKRSRLIAGGTDLVPLMREGIWSPDHLLNLKTVPALRYLRSDAAGLHIGALTTLDELDRSQIVRDNYPALAEAAHSAASPRLRNMATLGGNLLQQVRCWYYRGDWNCWLKGGSDCPARAGENQYHAVMPMSPCVAVYPSDPPVAPNAMSATLHIVGPRGERTIAIADFLQPPTEDRRAMHTLAPDEIIAEILVPPAVGRSVYLKAMDRAVWAYALVSVAIAGRVEAGVIYDPRVVLGAVANIPVRLPQIETLLVDQALDENLLHRVGELAVIGVEPLAHNGYKRPLIRNLVRQALRDLVHQS